MNALLDTKIVPMLAIEACLLALLIALLAFFLLGKSKSRKYRARLADCRNAVSIYILDIFHNNVTTFSSSGLSEASHFSLGEFYSHFASDEQTRVIEWVNSLLDKGSDAPDFLETNVQTEGPSKSRKQFYYLLQVDHVDRKRQIIHLQRHKLKYIVPKKSPKDFKGTSNSKQVIAALNDCKKRGFTACFRFQYRKISDKDAEIEPLIWTHIKTTLYGLTKQRRYLLEASHNELLVSDVKLSSKQEASHFVHSCIAAVNRYLALSGYLSKIDMRVGLVGHQFFDGNGEAILDYARKTAQIAFDDDEQILVYEKGRKSVNPLNDSSYRTEVERIINEKRLKYEFRPIYSANSASTIGFLTRCKPVDTYFDSIDELKDYAARTDDLGDLFSTIARNTMPLYVSERQDDKQALFFPVRTEERPYMLTTFARLPKAKTSRIVFLFNETDIKAHFNPTAPGDIYSDMRSIKAKGYSVALELNEGELGLPTTVYDAFDFFVCDFMFAGNAKDMDALVRSQLHVMVEKLLKYHKPIIANDIEGWASLELLVRSGLDFISAECFAPYSEMILPVAPKAIKRVAEFKR